MPKNKGSKYTSLLPKKTGLLARLLTRSELGYATPYKINSCGGTRWIQEKYSDSGRW